MCLVGASQLDGGQQRACVPSALHGQETQEKEPSRDHVGISGS